PSRVGTVPAGDLGGWEVTGRIPLFWEPLALEGWYARWSGARSWLYTPAQSWRRARLPPPPAPEREPRDRRPARGEAPRLDERPRADGDRPRPRPDRPRLRPQHPGHGRPRLSPLGERDRPRRSARPAGKALRPAQAPVRDQVELLELRRQPRLHSPTGQER